MSTEQVEHFAIDWFSRNNKCIWTRKQLDEHLVTNFLGDIFYGTTSVKVTQRGDLGADSWEVTDLIKDKFLEAPIS